MIKLNKKIALVVLDGYGLAEPSNDNAISLANPVCLNNLQSIFPFVNYTLQKQQLVYKKTNLVIAKLVI